MEYLKGEILSLIETRQGFVEISNELDSEVPQMSLQLRNYFQDDRAYYDILLQIRYRWGPIFSGFLKGKVSLFTTLYLDELERLENIIKFAENHPDVLRIKEQEMNNLTDELSSLMDPFSNIIRGIKRTSLKPRLTIVKKRKN